MKKTIVFALALVMALSLAACSNKSDAPDASSEGANTAKPQVSDEASIAPSSSPENTTPTPSAENSETSENIPVEYIGQWEGSTGDISLSFDLDANGKGVYTFEQRGYVESYDFTLEVGTETFSVQIPNNNKLGIAECEGTYEYSDGVMTLDIRTTFSDGRVFEYTVSCEKNDPTATWSKSAEFYASQAPEQGSENPVVTRDTNDDGFIAIKVDGGAQSNLYGIEVTVKYLIKAYPPGVDMAGWNQGRLSFSINGEVNGSKSIEVYAGKVYEMTVTFFAEGSSKEMLDQEWEFAVLSSDDAHGGSSGRIYFVFTQHISAYQMGKVDSITLTEVPSSWW